MSVERYTEFCNLNKKKWETFLTFIVIDKKKNEPVGFTTSVIGNYQPHVAWQWETGVLHGHRVNRLGLALKYQMLEKLLASPETKFWSTESYSSNIHMHRINKILGFKKWSSELFIDFSKDELQEFLTNIKNN